MSLDASTSAMADAEHNAQATRLRQLLRFATIACFGFVPIDLVLWLATGSPVVLIFIAVTTATGCAGLLGTALVRRGQIRAAALITGVAILIVAVAMTLAIPAITAAMVTMPILMVALLLPYLRDRTRIVLSVFGVLAGITIFLVGTLVPPLLTQPPMAVTILAGTIAVGMVYATALLLLGQYSSRIETSISQLHASNAELDLARQNLEGQVAARTADLEAALADVRAQAEAQARLLAENTQQREAIREMSVPVLPVSSEALVIPLIGALDSTRLRTVQEQALNASQASSAHYMLLDITGVPIVDTQVAHGLLSVVQAARLLGVEVVLVGVRPEVAQTVVTLGLDLHGIAAQQTLQEGIAYTMRGARRDHRKN